MRPPERLITVAYEVLALGEEDMDIEQDTNPIFYGFAMAASGNPDILYLDEALKAPDSAQFKQAMRDEVKAHTDNNHWVIVHRSSVPKGMKILPAVWAMRRKRRLGTGEVYKWKARLNVHGGKQVYGVNYWETYSPVVQWTSTRFFLTISVLRGWICRQLDFVLAYPQAPVETEMYIEIPRGFEFRGSRKTHCMKLLQNIYGQKQAGRVWNIYMTEKLVNELGFVQSVVDDCVFYKGNCVMLIYVDDTILMGPDQKEIDTIVESMASAFKISDEGTLADYLGVKIRTQEDGTMVMTQAHIIDSIIADLGIEGKKPRNTPALSTKILTRDEHGDAFDRDWDYRRVIGKLNYLEKCTRPELAYAVHQCARFSSDPKRSHADAVEHIGLYLLGTRDRGMIIDPKSKAEEFTCWADASFSGEWNREFADDDPTTAKSRSGHVAMFAGIPLTWYSKLQTEIALSSVECEYISLSQALREIISLMQLAAEAKQKGVPVFCDAKTKVLCRAFEDNMGALELANVPKMRPRTKHINIKYHHFREHVKAGTITVKYTSTEDQVADIFTKPLALDLFVKHRLALLGW